MSECQDGSIPVVLVVRTLVVGEYDTDGTINSMLGGGGIGSSKAGEYTHQKAVSMADPSDPFPVFVNSLVLSNFLVFSQPLSPCACA